VLKYYILYEDKIVRKGRLFLNGIPQSFNSKAEAENFALDMRCTLIDQGIPARRLDFYIFSSDTDLDRVQT